MGEAEPGVTEGGHQSPLPEGERAASRSEAGEGPRGRGKTPEDLLIRSRALRTAATEAEARLWSRLRAGRLDGLKFRRQVPIGRYIADVVCPSAKLVIEVDGSQHGENTRADEGRTAFLESEGYHVLRVWNNDVLGDIDAVLEAILASAAAPLPGASRLSLSPSGRGG